MCAEDASRFIVPVAICHVCWPHELINIQGILNLFTNKCSFVATKREHSVCTLLICLFIIG